MLAIHAAAPPAPRRQLLVGTALACVAGMTLFGGMLSVWMRFRDHALDLPEGRWLPNRIVVPEVPANVMWMAFLPIVVFVQWSVYAAKRDDRTHTGLALGLTALLGLAVVNAQAYVWAQMEVPVRGGAYNSMFYAITGTFTLLTLVGVGFTAVTAFRYLGGRSSDREIVAANALYWYFLAVVFTAVWLVVYVTK